MKHQSDWSQRAVTGPEIDPDVTGNELGREVTDRLRTLSKLTADSVAKHLVMTHRLLYDDPQLAYAHARAAAGRGSRVDVVREALGLAAYANENYAEALRELRTARRLGGGPGLVAVMADCERGLGRPERAITLADETDMRQLDRQEVVELGIVVAGARMDLDQPDAALVHLGRLRPGTDEERGRVESFKADVLEKLGRDAEAQKARSLATKLLPSPRAFAAEGIVTDLEGGE